mgnify:CR=1 FL=1
MAFGGLIITSHGRNALTEAQMGKTLVFTGIGIGDGTYTGSYNDIQSLQNELYRLPILSIKSSEGQCIIEADMTNAGLASGFYFREVGIYASIDGEEILYLYDNAGNDAEYIESASDVATIEKRLRFTINISGVENVSITGGSVLYVSRQEFDEAIQEIKDYTYEVIDEAKKKFSDKSEAIFKRDLYGLENFSLGVLDNLKAELSGQTVKVYSGDIIMQGRLFRLNEDVPAELDIDPGTSGTNRRDLIVARYHSDNEEENCICTVIKGSESVSPKDPDILEGDILSGEDSDMPLYRIILEGTEISGIERLFSTVPPFPRIRSGYTLPDTAMEGDIFLLLEGE